MLCCIGDLCEDVVVWPNGPIAAGDDTTATITVHRGGSAANVAYFAAALGQPARFIGAVGADTAGARLSHEMRFAGVDVKVQTRERSGTVVVLVDSSGERTMLSDRASATDLQDVPDECLDGVSWLHIPTYSLVVEPLSSTTATLAAVARERGIPISVDASSASLLSVFGVVRAAELIGPIDVLLANDDEARVIGLGWPAPVQITKRGAESTLIHIDGELRHEVPVAPVSPVVDSTGAGDAFAAGFIAARLRGANVRDSVSAANGVAAKVLGLAGATLT